MENVEDQEGELTVDAKIADPTRQRCIHIRGPWRITIRWLEEGSKPRDRIGMKFCMHQ